jgi:hypothetical protein
LIFRQLGNVTHGAEGVPQLSNDRGFLLLQGGQAAGRIGQKDFELIEPGAGGKKRQALGLRFYINPGIKNIGDFIFFCSGHGVIPFKDELKWRYGSRNRTAWRSDPMETARCRRTRSGGALKKKEEKTGKMMKKAKIW